MNIRCHVTKRIPKKEIFTLFLCLMSEINQHQKYHFHCSIKRKKNIKSAASGNKVTLTAFDDAKKEKTYE